MNWVLRFEVGGKGAGMTFLKGLHCLLNGGIFDIFSRWFEIPYYVVVENVCGGWMDRWIDGWM